MKRNLWGKGIRLSALVLALAAGAAGCVEPDPPSVAIAKKKASLVFGVTVNEPVKPITEQLPPLLNAPLEEPLFAEELDDVDLTAPPLNTAPKEACPKAELTAVAERIATHNVDGAAVPVGSYRWVVAGSVIQPTGTTPLAAFERRSLSEYTKNSDTVHQYKFTYRVGSFVSEDTYKVVTNGRSVGTTDGVNAAVQGPRAGENDRGLLLVHRRIINDKNQVVGEFAPQSGLLLLPLPVSPGEEWSSVAVDSKNGLTIIHKAKVIATKRVDACGELMDGWAVEATQTFVAAGGSSELRYDYVVAPQYGATLLSEHFVQKIGSSTVDVSYTIGQAKPSA